MSRKIKKKPVNQEVKAPLKKENKVLSFIKKHKTSIIISSVSVLLIVAFVIGLVAILADSDKFDYMTSDLSSYIYISPEEYKGYAATVAADTVDETDVKHAINQLLYENKNETPSHKGAEIMDEPLTVGDTAYIYYRGYTVDANGKQSDFSGGTNFSSEEMYKLGIGSGEFIPGFEVGLVGKFPNAVMIGDKKNFEIIREGTVEEGQIIYISGRVLNPNGTNNTFSDIRIDLSSDDIDAEWGSGFKNFLLGKSTDAEIKSAAQKVEIGNTLNTATFSVEGGSAVYYNLRVEYAIKTTAAPITVTATFPVNYSETTLRGKTVFFDVYFTHSVIYGAPEYDEKFITETLKLTDADLSAYDGATVVEKHTAKLRAELEEELRKAKNDVIEEEMWEHYLKKADIKKLPKSAVREVYDEIHAEINDMYEYYQTLGQSATFEQVACDYLGLSQGQDWDAYITAIAESEATEKLIVYYVARQEKLSYNDAPYQKYYDELIESHLELYIDSLYSDEIEKIEDAAKKEARIAEIKAEMFKYYSESYFLQNAYYNYALETLLGFASVNDGSAEIK